MLLKNLSKIAGVMLAISFLMSLSNRSNAQGSPVLGRAFTSTAGTTVTFNSAVTPVTNGVAVPISAKTTVTVTPYLFITGTLDTSVTVTGWGPGTYTTTSLLDVYHNMTLEISATGFGNPTSTTFGNTVTVPMQIRAGVAPVVGSTVGTVSYWFPYQSATSPISPAFFPVLTTFSQGHFQFNLDRTFTFDPTIGPTVAPYTNNATVNFTPEW